MALLATAVDSTVGIMQSLGLGLVIVLSLLLWATPGSFGMLPETQFVLTTVIVAVLYDSVVLADGADFGIGDLILSTTVGYGITAVMG